MTTLIKEKIEIEGFRWYPSSRKREVWYPSVTSILEYFPKGKRFEMYLANQESYESSQTILKAAGQRGTNVHKGTELLESGIVLLRENYSLEEWQHLEGFVNWWKKYRPEKIAIEKSLVSDKLKTGGTVDRIYRIGEEIVLLDIKTSSAIHDNYWSQTATYAKLWEEKYPECPITNTAILRTAPRRKDGYEFAIHTRNEIEEDFKIFKSVQLLWNYLNPNAKPKIIEVPETLSLNEN